MISEKYLKEIFKSSSSPMMVLLPDAPRFSIADVNDAYLKLNEFTREDAIGKGFFEVIYSSDKYYEIPGWLDSLEKVLTKKKPDKIPLRIYEAPVAGTLDSEIKYWEIEHIPILDDHNNVAFIIRSVNDLTREITDRKNTELALTDSRNQFYSLLQSIEGIVWEADADTLNFTFVSDHAKNILGFSPHEWLKQHRFWENHVYPGDRDEVLNYYNLKSRQARSYSFEYRMVKADGNIIWIKDIVSIVKSSGKPKWLRGLMLDITTTKRMSSLENLEKNVLELNSKSQVPFNEILLYYLRGIEALFPQMQCSILQVKNNRLYNWASPSLPAAYIESVKSLPIAENAGSCGTAAYLGKKVIVSDVENDIRWAGYKHIPLKYNLRACWSYPVINSDGKVMATLGMYYKEIKKPDEEELRAIERVTALLKIILENRQKAEIIAEATVLMKQSQELAHFGNWHWDVQNNMVSWSDSLYTIYGLRKTDFKATFEGYQDLLHPDDRQRVYNIIEHVLKTGEDVEFEERIIRPDGEVRYLKSWGKLKTDASGLPLEMIGACLDITESKKTQEELQASEARLRTLADSQTNYVIRIGLDGKYIYFNKKYIEDFQWILKDRELLETDATFTVQPYHHQLVTEIITKCIKKPNRVYQVELDKLQEGGGAKPTLWHFVGLSNARGETVEIQCIGLDVADLKNAETALKISNERYEYINKASNDAIFDWDIISGNVKWGNGFFRLFGFDSSREYSFDMFTLQLHPDDKERIMTGIMRVIEGGTADSWSGEFRLKKANGKYAFVEGNGYIIRNETGKGLRMIGVIRDITERLNYIDAIEKQNKKLREIAWMQSHVVRSPLTKIMGLIDLIKDFPDNNTEQNQLLDHLMNSACELDGIIRNISEKTEQIDLKMDIAAK